MKISPSEQALGQPMTAQVPFADPHLASLAAALTQVTNDVEALCAPLDQEVLLRVPGPKRWSVAQVFEHLKLINRLYFPRIERAAAATRERGLRRRGDFRPTFMGRFMINMMDPNSKTRLRTFSIFSPTPGVSPGSWRDFVADQAIFHRLLREVDGYDLTQVRLASPVTALLRFGVGDALTALVLHEQRHLLQARRTLDEVRRS